MVSKTGVTLYTNGNASMRNSKVVIPERNLLDSYKVVECQLKNENQEPSSTNVVTEKVWSLSGNFYGNTHNTITHIKQIIGVYDTSTPQKTHELYGCTDNFAMYNSNGTESQYIVVKLAYDQFCNLLFSNSDLVSAFTLWLYRKVVHSELSDESGGIYYGEYYLNKTYGNFVNKVN